MGSLPDPMINILQLTKLAEFITMNNNTNTLTFSFHAIVTANGKTNSKKFTGEVEASGKDEFATITSDEETFILVPYRIRLSGIMLNESNLRNGLVAAGYTDPTILTLNPVNCKILTNKCNFLIDNNGDGSYDDYRIVKSEDQSEEALGELLRPNKTDDVFDNADDEDNAS